MGSKTSRIIDLRNIKRILYLLILLLLMITSSVYIVTEFIYPVKYTNIIEKYAQVYSLSPELVYSVILAESRFNPLAKSHKDAKGLMQISEQTAYWAATEIGIENFEINKLYDPEVNIQIGCWYINRLLNQYNGNKKITLSAYNAGSGNVAKWLNNTDYSQDGINLDIIPFPETRNYVKKIEKNIKIYRLLLYAFQNENITLSF